MEYLVFVLELVAFITLIAIIDHLLYFLFHFYNSVRLKPVSNIYARQSSTNSDYYPNNQARNERVGDKKFDDVKENYKSNYRNYRNSNNNKCIFFIIRHLLVPFAQAYLVMIRDSLLMRIINRHSSGVNHNGKEPSGGHVLLNKNIFGIVLIWRLR